MNSRYTCPNCGKKKEFIRYIDIKTNEHIADFVGKCNRLNNCGYHFTPKQYFEENKQEFEPVVKRNAVILPKKEISYIHKYYLTESQKGYDKNNFILFLMQQFGIEETNQAISKYSIGTSKHWTGATVFWQIDIHGKIRTGKIMLYDANTGKRIKEPRSYIAWVHKIIKMSEYELRQCFFGEHLLKNDLLKPIAIVESEKTAIIASIFLPKFIWLACGNVNGLSAEKCKVLKGRNVVLYPDINCFDLWSKKAKQLCTIANFKVSDLLELNASNEERKQGLDIADYLLRFDLSKYEKM